MDLPSVQSSSKCSGSDFSIERILGDTRSKPPFSGCKDSPSWLCCTRYQPPRLPRNSAASGRARRSGRHARVPFTGAQAAALEAAYARAHYLAPPALRALAAALHLRDDRIKIWFQNRRARERREKNGNVTPPRAVTLQPTSEYRISAQQDSPPPWSRVDSPTNNASLIDLRTNSTNLAHSLVNNDMIPAASCPILLYNKPPSHLPNNDNIRCESPLDIETIDS